MIVSLITFLAHILYYLPLPGVYIYIDSIYYLAHLSLFPLYYIYVRLLAIDTQFSLKQHYKYLILPLGTYLLYAIGTLFISRADYISFLYPTSSGIAVNGTALYLKMTRHLINAVFVGQGITYMTLSILTVRNNSIRIANYYSNSEYSLRKVQWLNISLLITICTTIIMEIISKEYFVGDSTLLIAPSVILTVMLFWIGLLGNSQQQVLLACEIEDEIDEAISDTIIEEQDNQAEDNSTNTPTIQQHALQMKIENLFEEKQMYLNQNLTICDLAEEVGTNRTYISRLINNDIGVNFSQFVNSYRLTHARRLAAEQPQLSKEDIAIQSGFGSANSMRRAEKRI